MPMPKCRRLVGRSWESITCQTSVKASRTWRKLGNIRVSFIAMAEACHTIIKPSMERAATHSSSIQSFKVTPMLLPMLILHPLTARRDIC